MSVKNNREIINKLKRSKGIISGIKYLTDDWIIKELVDSIEECLELIEEHVEQIKQREEDGD
jgi:hypothetical protein